MRYVLFLLLCNHCKNEKDMTGQVNPKIKRNKGEADNISKQNDGQKK